MSTTADTLDLDEVAAAWLAASRSLGSRDRRMFKSMLVAAIRDGDGVEARRVLRSALEHGGFHDEILVRRSNTAM